MGIIKRIPKLPHKGKKGVFSLFGFKAAFGFFQALAPFGLKPFFPRGTAGFCWAAEMGEPGGVYDEGFHTGIGPLQIGALGALLACGDNKFPRATDAGAEGFPQARDFGFVKAFEIVQAHAQGNLGVDLVDVLAARSAGTGKVRPGGGADGLIQ